jgi:hypothetical protein
MDKQPNSSRASGILAISSMGRPATISSVLDDTGYRPIKEDLRQGEFVNLILIRALVSHMLGMPAPG